MPATLSNVVSIACGGYHSLAARVDGTVVAWGNNYLGPRTVPTGDSPRAMQTAEGEIEYGNSC